MRIAVLGLGYVGTVSAACLAALGHEVCGVDVNPIKVEQINGACSPIAEESLEELIRSARAADKLHATLDIAEAIGWADASLICVGTPSRHNGSLDTSHVEHVICQIGQALCRRETRHTVIVRSTLLPGSTLGMLQPLLEEVSGKQCGPDIGLAYNPEFLREGTAVRDFHEPPYTVIGGIDEASIAVAESIYSHINAPIHKTAIPEAEMIKYSCNAFHALKICFANEIGNFSKAMGVDGHIVMNILAQDTKLNMSPYYTKPGFAYGGSCLPKDVRAILFAARQRDLDLPVLQSLPRSNELQLQRGIELVTAQGSRKVGVLGLSFKAGTDDLRESPIIALIETLLGKGYQLKLYDKNVSWARLTGANKSYIEGVIPHVADLMVDTVEEVVAESDVIVIGNNSPEFSELLKRPIDKTIIDLVRPLGMSTAGLRSHNKEYHGIAW